MQAIVEILKECNSNNKSPLLFVGFQEVTSTLRQYLFPDLEKMGYNLATQPLHTSYGIGLAVSKQVSVLESKFVPYPTSLQGRGLLYARTATHLFATTHLESFISTSNDGSHERQRQILLVTRFCQEQLAKYPNLEVAIVSGDFNWDDERKGKGKACNAELISLLDDGWRDAGQPFDYTYDGVENCMLGGGLRRRLDRCIYLRNDKNSSSNIAKVSLEKFGKDPIVPNLSWRKINPYNGKETVKKVAPSDHFAIGVRFQK
jgi:endonuclease/exonuclease/phosphatase family metal-dependent hydrolase